MAKAVLGVIGGSGRDARERDEEHAVDRLEQGRVENAFERLVVVAAPTFLGLLRAHFNAPLSSLLSLEIDKDYTALRPEELRTRLPERL